MEVLAFSSADEYGRACVKEPPLRAHLLMHCDAAEGAESDSDEAEEVEQEEEEQEEGALGGKRCACGGKDAAAARARASAKAAAPTKKPDRKGVRAAASSSSSITARQLRKLHAAMGLVPAVPHALQPWRVLRVGGLLCQLSNQGSHAEKKFCELNRASATTSRVDCWQKRAAEAGSTTARVRIDAVCGSMGARRRGCSLRAALPLALTPGCPHPNPHFTLTLTLPPQVDVDGSRVDLVAVREPAMNKETDAQRCG